MKLPTSLRARLILSHLIVSLVSIALLSAYVGQTIYESTLNQAQQNQESKAVIASNQLEQALLQLDAGRTSALAISDLLSALVFEEYPDLVFAVYNYPSGELILSNEDDLGSRTNRIAAPEIWAAGESESGKGHDVRPDSRGVDMLYTAVPVMRENQIMAIVSIGEPYQPVVEAAQRSLFFLILAASAIALGVSMAGWLLANNLAQPIQHLTLAAEELAQGDLTVRVIPSGTDEMRRLAETFNTMAVRLQTHVSELRAFVANASHELRTPLTVVKLRAEALCEGALEDPNVSQQFLTDIDHEVDRLVRMVNDLLDLSRIEAGMVSSERGEINLASIATEVYETFSIRASRDEIDLTLDLQPDLPPVLGNEDQIRRVLYNLVENAIKYNEKGGMVELLVMTGIDDKFVRILVKDSGPGIAPDHLAHIFERFYRVEATRPRVGNHRGSGLGLAIAKSIVESHGGKIGVTSQLGRGTTFWVELPIKSQA